MTVRRAAAALTVIGLLAGACTSAPAPQRGAIRSVHPPTAAPPSAPDDRPSPVPTGPGSAEAVRRALCDLPMLRVGPPANTTGPVPDVVSRIEDATVQSRELDFEHPVPVEALTDAELNAKLRDIFDASISSDQLARRSRVWQTMGVIPTGTDIETSLRTYLAGQVVGFYVPETGELVYLGSDSQPSLLEAAALSHELTHAIDDQHFELVRVDRLGASCRDERQAAALGAVEGSAQFFSFRALAQLQDIATGTGNGEAGGSSTEGVPPFIQQLQLWSYTAGLAFIQARFDDGGIPAVNETLRHLPVSTEQVIHPERYPDDVPTPLDIPDLGPKLGTGWTDLDVMTVGEEWLQFMLALHLEGDELEVATSGWDGGIYRAWSHDTRTVVVLATAWDSPKDADEFATAMQDYVRAGGIPAIVRRPAPDRVTVGFTNSEALAGVLTGVLGG
jgi:hypothetical protein